MTIVSYLRVSTTDQTVENQRQAIKGAGWEVSKEFTDEAVSGATQALDRPGWARCRDYLRDGDTLVVFAVDRLGRSTVDVLLTIKELSEKGVRLVIIKQGFDTDTPAGKLALTVFAGFAEFETEIRKERQREGIARARKELRENGSAKYAGRPPKLKPEQRLELTRRYHAGENHSALAREFGIDRATAYRIAKAEQKAGDTP